MRLSRRAFFILLLLSIAIPIGTYQLIRPTLKALPFEIGDEVDSLHGVVVYYNGPVGNVTDRNLSPDGYNLGLRYQCVEFVKRYYYEHLNHKMPNSYGHAKDFFQGDLEDGKLNRDRNLTQYTNPSSSKPEVGDLLVMNGNLFNKYGHVAIISNVSDEEVEIIQQNPGRRAPSREQYSLQFENGKWIICRNRILGWLRKE